LLHAKIRNTFLSNPLVFSHGFISEIFTYSIEYQYLIKNHPEKISEMAYPLLYI